MFAKQFILFGGNPIYNTASANQKNIVLNSYYDYEQLT